MKPLILTFQQLAHIFRGLHMWHKPYVDRLHDVWLQGAPSPQSIIRNPKGYDPRKAQVGNYEARIVLPTPLAKWIDEVASERGMSVAAGQAKQLVKTVGNLVDFESNQTFFDLRGK